MVVSGAAELLCQPPLAHRPATATAVAVPARLAQAALGESGEPDERHGELQQLPRRERPLA
eukprot:1260258-Alexandrium_andersonii.AAC.1